MKGELQTHWVDSEALRDNPWKDPHLRKLLVYGPSGSGNERLPTVYFLHGYAGSVEGWTQTSAFTRNVLQRIDALWAKGLVPPFLAVFVDGWNTLGGTQWQNSSAHGRYRDYLVKDVVPYVDRHFSTVTQAEGRAAVGKSSGGYGAMLLGRHHPDVFAHVASHSGDSAFEYCYLPDFPKALGPLVKAGGALAWFKDFLQRTAETKLRGDDFPVVNTVAMAAAYSPQPGAPLGLELPFDLETGRLREQVWERWLAQDPVRFIPQSGEAFVTLKTIFIDCGTRDEYGLRWGARMMVEELKKLGVQPLHEEFEDGHSGTTYRFDRSLCAIVPRMLGGS